MAEIRFHDAAREEYLESYLWYFERGIHIAATFEHEVDLALQAILEKPEQWPVYTGKWRRILLRRFPFAIIYKQADTLITVIAVMHTSRRPGYWKARN